MDTKIMMQKIKEIMNLRGLSQYEVCKRAGISRMTFLNWNQRGSIPKLETLEAICQELDIPISQLFEEEDIEKLSAEQKRLIQYWTTLTREEKDAIFCIIYAFSKNKNNKEALEEPLEESLDETLEETEESLE